MLALEAGAGPPLVGPAAAEPPVADAGAPDAPSTPPLLPGAAFSDWLGCGTDPTEPDEQAAVAANAMELASTIAE